MAKASGSHSWSFFRAGGVDQVVLRDAADLEHLAALDLSLWTALACPVKGLDLDERTLALVDTDHDGRIRPPEVLAAVAWAKDVFKDVGQLFRGGDVLPLASLDRTSVVGKKVHAAAKRVLAGREKQGAEAISLEDVTNAESVLASMRHNGDGVVPPSAVDEDDARRAIEDAIATVGSRPDRSGQPGIDAELAARFFDDVAALAAHRDRGARDEARPLGDATEAACARLVAVEAKVEDWFARCRLAAFDARAGGLLGGAEADLVALAAAELSREAEAVAKLPLARVEPGRPLPLGDGVNPAWGSRLRALADEVVAPLLGARDALSEADWGALVARFAEHRAWAATKPTTPVASLEPARLAALAEPALRERVLALIAEDAAVAPELEDLEAVERAVRYQRDLARLLKNFVAFADFYGKKGGAFQVGTLYLDGRACELVVRVDDAAKHAALAGLAKSYLVYCDCTRAGEDKLGIVAVVTGGSTDNLLVGRNAVFYDRRGRDWDATVTKIVENPISVRQAFFAPYERFVRLVEEQLAKRAAAAETEATSKVDAAAVSAAAEPPKPGDKPAVPPAKFDVGTVAALGVAVGGLATFLSSIVATFLGLGMWMPFGVVALLLAISGPSMLIAWLKLRQRNLGPILDACGWAINGRVRVNVPFGASLTRVASLPAGAERSLVDPFAEPERPVKRWVLAGALVLLGALWFFGKLDAYLPDRARASVVLHRTPVVATER